jgi:dTDP-glucose 4,6-dehydratase|tara:strand:+ start:779 stop:1690 length:912 start_codon:yes stop_codon:yes gene_type:complete
MRVIVTGGAGFIGSSFVNYLRKNVECEIVVIDKLTYASNPFLIPADIQLIKKDICDIELNDIGYADYIVNFAAESHVDNSISNGLPFVKTNVEGTFNMLEVARKIPNLKKFVQISTDEVYGDMDSRELPSANENTSFKPSSYYSSTKAAADHLVQAAGRTYGLPYLITRTCNNFGEHQHSEKFLPTIARSIKNDNPIPLYGDGNHIREWIWVEDNVRMVYDLMISDIGIWNIGSGDSWTNKKIIEEVGLILNKKADFKYVDDRLGHDARYTIDISKLEYHYNTNNLTTKDIRKFLLERFGSSN